jgi:hypothetical protein
VGGVTAAELPPDDWAEPEPPRLFYASLDLFVAEQLAPLYRRPLGAGRTWCPEWWRHAEGITRLEALWRSWEHLRHEPALGMSVWLRDHADVHMAVLLDGDGPFHGCHPDKGHNSGRLGPLPVLPPPAGLFPLANGGNGDNVPNAPIGG